MTLFGMASLDRDRTTGTTAQGVGTASAKIKVSSSVLSGGAAAEEVIFRRTGAGAEILRIPLAIGENLEITRGFQADSGLEVLTADAAGDVHVTVFYFDA